MQVAKVEINELQAHAPPSLVLWCISSVLQLAHIQARGGGPSEAVLVSTASMPHLHKNFCIRLLHTQVVASVHF
jgi:hypothetical protein